MARVINTIINLFTYEEPTNDEMGFELLEDENEGNENDISNNNQDPNVQNNSHQDTSNLNNTQNNTNKSSQNNPSQNNPQSVNTTANIQENNNANNNNKNIQSTENNNDQANSQDNPMKNEKQNEKSETNTQNLAGVIKKGSAKAPLKVEEWNKNKNTEIVGNPCQAQNNTDNISTELCINLETIKQKFLMPKNQDIIIREFKIGRQVKAFMVYIDGMMDKQTLNLAILPTLMEKDALEGQNQESTIDYIIENILTVNDVNKTDKYSQAIMQILNGKSSLFIEGCNQCIIIETRGYEKRNVDKPTTETVVTGSQEGFSENLRTNLTLIRRIIKNEKLVTEILPIGDTNHSNCAIIYLDGIVNPKVVEEVKKRISKINTDFIQSSGMIEQFIEDNSFALFPQILSTERPDRAASFIMEGQVVIIADGTPFVLTVPITFFRLMHTSEDYNIRWPYANFLRLIRIIGWLAATFLPGLYVAVTLYHPEMIPTELMSSMAQAKESVPFPTIVEVLVLELSFELIREGGIRVPSVIGQTLGIVGALILGQAAVSAGLVSPILVIIVALTALGSFTIPNYNLALAIRIERFLFIFAGFLLGIYGISLLMFILAVWACSMKSFGVPYFAPISPRTDVNPDVIMNYPIWMQKKRPDEFNTPNRKRQGKNKKLWISESSKEEDGDSKND